MGYYIQTPAPRGKAKYLQANYGATLWGLTPPKWQEVAPDKAIICVVDNGPFEVAAFCYDECELRRFTFFEDIRPKTWLLMPRDLVENLTSYRGNWSNAH